jgi:hypothetical protein
MRRFFLVGCPRSGTTLLQSMTARHPAVFSFPESHYFHKVRGRFGVRPPGRAVSPRAAARTLDALAEALGRNERPPVPRWWPFIGLYGRAFVSLVDQATVAAGAMTWLEKSPVHLRYIDTIARVVEGSRFIHQLRDGRDVVASLLVACDRDPDRWIPQLVGRSRPTPEDLLHAAIERWNDDLATSLAHVGHPDHLHVLYEELLDDSLDVLGRICSFMSIPLFEGMADHSGSVPSVVGWRQGMPHMEGLSRPLQDRRLKQFHSRFESAERELIARRLDHGGDAAAALVAARTHVLRP